MKTYTFRIESSYCVETTVTLGDNEDVDFAFDSWLADVQGGNSYCETLLDRTFEIVEPITLTPVNVEELQDETEIP
jgi:hypothetical protein